MHSIYLPKCVDEKIICNLSIVCLIIMNYFWLFTLNAQQALNSSGGSLSLAAGNYIEFSIGEIATMTTGAPGSDHYFTAGVIQPWYTFLESRVNDHFDLKYYVKAYPNPAEQTLIIETDFSDFHYIEIYNQLGQKILLGDFRNAPIDLGFLPAGLYFLTLRSKDRQISKTIKIVKK